MDTAYTVPANILKLNREWRDAWNRSAEEFNQLVLTARERYGRMHDARLLPMIPPGEVKVPGLDYSDGPNRGKWLD